LSPVIAAAISCACWPAAERPAAREPGRAAVARWKESFRLTRASTMRPSAALPPADGAAWAARAGRKVREARTASQRPKPLLRARWNKNHLLDVLEPMDSTKTAESCHESQRQGGTCSCVCCVYFFFHSAMDFSRSASCSAGGCCLAALPAARAFSPAATAPL